jgi:hypothetical protein
VTTNQYRSSAKQKTIEPKERNIAIYVLPVSSQYSPGQNKIANKFTTQSQTLSSPQKQNQTEEIKHAQHHWKL